MQITRHWRLNAWRYRLQGVRYENGMVSTQARPIMPEPKVEVDSEAVKQFTEMLEMQTSPGRERRG